MTNVITGSRIDEFADDVHRLELDLGVLAEGTPSYAMNVYLIGGVLIDSGTRQLGGQILECLAGQDVTAHALTHAHMDHQGSSHVICDTLGIPLFCPEGEADNMESGEFLPVYNDNPVHAERIGMLGGPGHHVTRRLREGDEVGGFVVVESGGHSPGHVSYWRESDGVLVAGDAIFNFDPLTAQVALIEPPAENSIDPAQTRKSIRKLAALEPRLVCFGHGPILEDMRLLEEFVAALPPDD